MATENSGRTSPGKVEARGLTDVPGASDLYDPRVSPHPRLLPYRKESGSHQVIPDPQAPTRPHPPVLSPFPLWCPGLMSPLADGSDLPTTCPPPSHFPGSTSLTVSGALLEHAGPCASGLLHMPPLSSSHSLNGQVLPLLLVLVSAAHRALPDHPCHLSSSFGMIFFLFI